MKLIASLLFFLCYFAHASDAQCLSQAIYYEARGGTQKQQEAVAHSILNRAKKRSLSVCATIHQPKQYSWWNKKVPANKHTQEFITLAMKLLEEERKGRRRDVTKGATHFATRKTKNKLTRAFKMVYSDRVHSFYKES